MNPFKKKEELNEIIKGYEKSSPLIIMILIILTLGVYVINWIFLRNREFEFMDNDAPDAKRGLALMIFLPFGWALTMFVLKKLIFTGEPLILGILEIVIWGLIVFLLMNYIFDFCLCFSRITKTSPIIWFIPFLLGFVGSIFLALGFYYVSPLIFFTIIVVPAMQAELQSHFFPNKKYKRDKGRRQSSIMSVH